MNRPTSDVPDDDPRRCVVRGAGAFHYFGEKGHTAQRCFYCGVSVHTVVERLGQLIDELRRIAR